MRLSPLLHPTLLVALLPALAAAQPTPAAAIDRARLVSRVVTRGVQAGGFPGASVAMGTSNTMLLQLGFGRTAWGSGGSDVSARGTAYDLASLTKVVATTSAIMLLVDDGKIRLDDPVARHLSEFRGDGRDRITIRDVLMHRAGLPSGPDLRGTSSVSEARSAVLRTQLAYPPRSRSLYSDVGPIVLGLLAERVAGEPLEEMVGRRVFGPLGMRATRFGAPAGYAVAPTRDDAPAGMVHDPNAQRLGGTAGHAGLFSTAADLARFARMLLGGGMLDDVRIFGDSTVALFTHRQAGGRPLGWDMCLGGGRCGLLMSDATFGHTGFTGTALWIDPEQDVFVIFLSNAVHGPHAYDNIAVLTDVRADLADLAVRAAADDSGAIPLRLRSEVAINWFRQGATPRSLSGN
jgi:CubicO group peptidase (beta-lactamase class C family)